jgi:hypothetical protein
MCVVNYALTETNHIHLLWQLLVSNPRAKESHHMSTLGYSGVQADHGLQKITARSYSVELA